MALPCCRYGDVVVLTGRTSPIVTVWNWLSGPVSQPTGSQASRILPDMDLRGLSIENGRNPSAINPFEPDLGWQHSRRRDPSGAPTIFLDANILVIE